MTVLATLSSHGGLAIPYTVDANTLHLWHFDETSGTNCFDLTTNSQTSPIVLSLIPGQANPPYGIPTEFALMGQSPAFPVLGSSIMTTQYSCFLSPFLSQTADGYVTNLTDLATSYSDIQIYTNLSDYVNTNTGAFTFEAIIKPIINPLAPPNNMEIVCGDDYVTSSTSTRGWLFRITKAGQLEYNDVANSGSDFKASLPSSGPDAAVAGGWYHVALTFTGTAPTNGDPADVLTMYWTALDQTRTNCDVLATFTKTSNPGGMPAVAIGGSIRGSPYNNVANSEGFWGYIDEARISCSCRKSNEMAFNGSVVMVAPTFSLEPPASTLVGYGKTLTLNTLISGSPPLHIVWKQNGTVLAGQTNAALVISNVTFAADGNYQCFATNSIGGSSSAIAAVSVGAAFEGLFNTGVDTNGQPFNPPAVGQIDLHYSLVQSPDPNSTIPYALVWSNPPPPSGGYMLDSALSTWIGPEQNEGKVDGVYDYEIRFLIDGGDVASATLSGNVTAAGMTGGSTLQIFVNGVETDVTMPANPINSFTPFTITTANGLQQGSNVVDFVANCTGNPTRGFRTELTGIGQAFPPGLPVITNLDPASLEETVQAGTAASFAGLALGRPPLAYHWLYNGSPLDPALYPGADTRSLTLSAANGDAPTLSSMGDYQLVASNDSGSVTSSVIHLTVIAYPQLLSFPVPYTNPMTVFAGTSPRFSVSIAGGMPPFGYQWYSNDVALADATNAVFQPTDLPVGSWGNLQCMVTNDYGSATSTLWTVQVVAAPAASYAQRVLAAQPIAYWRLNEPDSGVFGNDGVIAVDYAGGNNGIYTNVYLGLAGYNPVSDPTTTSAEFGETGISFYDSYAGQIQGIDFAAPAGSNADFTVEAWVNAYTSGQITGGAVVTKGVYGNNDAFNLGFDSASTHHYRFYVRSADGSVYSATSSFVPDGQWHHLAGVCDESDGQVLLYIDGNLAASTVIPVGAGQYEAANEPVTIGAATDNATNSYNRQFYGYLNDVALYNYALSAVQIAQQYSAAGVAPLLLQSPPTTVSVYEGGVLTLPVLALGTRPLTNTWFDTFNFTNITQTVVTGTNVIDGTLVVSNVPVGWDFDTLQLTVANAYGVTNVNVTLTVNSGPPTFVKDLPPAATGAQGHAYTYSVAVVGSLPISYQWRFNGADVPGQTTTNYTFDPTAGNYSVVASNAYGAVTSTISALAVLAPPTDAYSSEILNTLGAVGYWPLQDTGAPAPATIETNLGTLGARGNAYYATINDTAVGFGQGGALTGSGDSDPAVAINGGAVSSYALVPRVSPELTLQPPLSIECWVNSSSTAFADILGEGGNGLNSADAKGNCGGIRMSWAGTATGANLQMYTYTGSGNTRDTGGTPADSLSFGVWHHCVATYDGTNVEMYIDGQPEGSFTATMALDTWTPITLGGGMWYGGAVHRHYTGLLDEVAFYTNVLSATAITNHYLAGITYGSDYRQTVLNDKPLLYYRMDAPGYTNPPVTLGAPAVNFGSSLVQGTYLPGAVPGGFQGPQNSTFGMNSLAMRDNGLNGCVDAGYDPAFDPTSNQPVTAMIWAKGYPSDNRFQNPMGRGNSSWRLGWDGRTGLAHWNAGAGGEITSTQIVNDGNWHFLAGVFDGTSNYLYIDGVLDGESAATGPIVGNSEDLYLGGVPDYTSGSSQRFFGGAIAKAAYFTNALSAAQIQQIYDLAGLVPGQTPVINASGNQIIYTGTLLSSTNVAGPFNPVAGASSPYIIPRTGPQMFYRARNP